MKRSGSGWLVILASLVTLLLSSFGFATLAYGQTADFSVKGNLKSVASGVSPFSFEGHSSELGDYHTYSEIRFTPGSVKGQWDSTGVAVFRTATGDQAVAKVVWACDSSGNGKIRFEWQDSVSFADGSVAHSTGRFAKVKPVTVILPTSGMPLVVISIIAILIG